METWKEIPGYEGILAASNTGKIKSIARTVLGGRGMRITNVPEKIYKQRIGNTGYLVVSTRIKGKPVCFLVHRLVAKAFFGDSDLQIDHINGNKIDNRIENLRFCTALENKMYYLETAKKSSKHFGISFNKRRQTWQPRVKIEGKWRQLGNYKTEENALNARNNFLAIYK
jgi:HNH endonuclease/NUMOD4 motif